MAVHVEMTCFKALPKRQTAHIRMPSHWACNMSPLGGSAEALWPTIFQNALKITCFKALPKRETPHIRMASHWACNMSPLGRAGAPALRAESGAAFSAAAVSDSGREPPKALSGS